MCGSYAKIGYHYIIWLLLALSTPCFALSQEKCPLPESRDDVINCALKLHPDVKVGDFKVKSVFKLEDQASQIPNPDFSARYVKGGNNSEDVSGVEANLGFTIELGGKRDSRKQNAKAQISEVLATNKAIKAEIKVNTILALYRLRQLMHEKRLLSETLIAFSKVTGQLKKLPRLSAEQEASLTLFEIAFAEAKVNQSALFDEERELERFFSVATGYSLHELKNILPESVKAWPQVGARSKNAISPEVERLESLVSVAQTEFSIQKSDAWPDLKVGPSFSMEREGVFENKMYGVNIEIPIPMFQLNGGGKSYAKSKLIKSQHSVSILKSEEGYKRLEKLRVYNNAIRILNTTMQQNIVDKKHKRIEKLYLRGVVSSSLFLDSLKQKMDYLKSRNNRELTALEALLSIYTYDGKVFEVKI